MVCYCNFLLFRIDFINYFHLGKAIACGYEDGSVSLFDVESGTELFSMGHHTEPVLFMSWSSAQSLSSKSDILSDIQSSIQKSFKNRSFLLPDRGFNQVDESLFDFGSLQLSNDRLMSELTKNSLPILCSVTKNSVVLS